MNYYINKKVKGSFEETIKLVTEALSKEGFGVLSKISIHEKFKEKLNVDFRKYIILGACNPSYALKALIQEDKIGTMLPCNVLIQEIDKHTMEVAAVDPLASMMAVKNDNLNNIAIEIQGKLIKVIDSLP